LYKFNLQRYTNMSFHVVAGTGSSTTSTTNMYKTHLFEARVGLDGGLKGLLQPCKVVVGGGCPAVDVGLNVIDQDLIFAMPSSLRIQQRVQRFTHTAHRSPVLRVLQVLQVLRSIVFVGTKGKPVDVCHGVMKLFVSDPAVFDQVVVHTAGKRCNLISQEVYK
jgi:hypothetical protein